MTFMDLNPDTSTYTTLTEDTPWSPCDCLPPPPDFHFPPPPLLPIFGGDSELEMASLLASDPLLQSCPSTSWQSVFGGPDHTRTVPAWLNGNTISVTKSRTDMDLREQNSVLTVLGVVAGVTFMLLIFVAVLVAYYCRKKRTLSADQLICLQGLTVNRPSSTKFNQSNSTRSCLTKFSTSGTDVEIFTKKLTRKDSNGNDEDAEIAVGADWTYRSSKRKYEGTKKPTPLFVDKPPNDSAIYDVPHLPPPTIKISTDTPSYPLIQHQLQSYTSYDNHNPVYEEISLNSDCQDPWKPTDSHIYSECIGQETGISKENYTSICKVCSTDQREADAAKKWKCRHNQNGSYENKKGTIISPKRSKRYYTNGSLAVSLAEGFEINVQQSAFV